MTNSEWDRENRRDLGSWGYAKRGARHDDEKHPQCYEAFPWETWPSGAKVRAMLAADICERRDHLMPGWTYIILEPSYFVRFVVGPFSLDTARRIFEEVNGRPPPGERVAISDRRRFAVLQRDGFRCRYCGVTAAEARLEVDHVRPVSRGGGSEMDNLATACRSCNAGKATLTGVKPPEPPGEPRELPTTQRPREDAGDSGKMGTNFPNVPQYT